MKKQTPTHRLSLHDGQTLVDFVLPADPLEAAQLVAFLIAENTEQEFVGFGGVERILPDTIANEIGR